MFREQLASDIADYKQEAEALQIKRNSLVRRIESLTRIEIIPQIESLLPKNYSIDREDISCLRTEYHDSVPVVFHLALRLLYKSKPILLESPKDRQIVNIHRKLNPRLEEIAKEYNLGSIKVFGKPEH